MIKRFLVALAAVAVSATLGLAAPVKAKVTAIDGKKVTIELVDEKAAWMKKGAPVRWKGGVGRISVMGDKGFTVNSRNAAKLKVGDELQVDKGPADLQGC